MTSRSAHRGSVVARRVVSTAEGAAPGLARIAGAAPQRKASDSWSGLDDGDPMGDVSAQTGMSPDEEDEAAAQGTSDDYGASVKS